MARAALIGIMIEDPECAGQINDILHTYREYIIGRMGLPHVKDNLSIISIAIDAPDDIISALSGKLGRLSGVSTKTIYSKLSKNSEEVKP